MATAQKQNTPAERPIDRIRRALGGVIEQIESVLPQEYKGRAEWFTNRAVLTFLRGNWKLQKCTVSSFVQCVVNGAELGIPIDGKLGYAVPYNNKKKLENGKEEWVMEAQFQPSYIALKVIAKRSGQVKDAYAEIVRENDFLEHAKMGDQCAIKHTWDHRQHRGNIVGVYAVVILPGGLWRYEWMDLEEVGGIRGRSKSGNDGPWVTDFNEMARKTVLRRALKTDCSDPGFIMAVQHDEAEYETEAVPVARSTRSPLTDQLGLPSPKARTQFEQDLDAGPQHASGAEEAVYTHTEPAEAPKQMQADSFTPEHNDLIENFGMLLDECQTPEEVDKRLSKAKATKGLPLAVIDRMVELANERKGQLQ